MGKVLLVILLIGVTTGELDDRTSPPPSHSPAIKSLFPSAGIKYQYPHDLLTILEVQVIEDFFSNQPYTPVILATEKVRKQMITHEGSLQSIKPAIYMDIDITAEKVNGINQVHVLDNKDLVYIIVDTSGLSKYGSIIRRIRQNSRSLYTRSPRITVFSGINENSNRFYHGHDYYDVFLLKQTYDNSFDIFEICRFCNSGKHQVKRVNMWKSGRGFMQPEILKRSFKNSFYNTKVNIETYLGPLGNKSVLYKQLDTLSYILNARFVYLPARFRSSTQLYRFEVGFHHVTGKYYDYTTYTLVGTEVIISYKPPRDFLWYSFVNVYPEGAWGLIGSVYIISGMLLYLLKKYNHTNEDVTQSIVECYWQLTQIGCWDCIRSENRSVRVCIFLSAYMLVALFLISDYFGTLTSVVMVRKDEYSPINSLEQLWNQTDTKIMMSSVYAKIQLPVYLELFKNLPNAESKFKITNSSGLSNLPMKQVTFARNDIADLTIKLYHTDRFGNTVFHIGREEFFPVFMAFILPKHAYYENALNQAICTMHANGIMLHIRRSFYQENYASLARENAMKSPIIPQPGEYIELKHLIGGFFLLAAGYVLALFVFLFEKSSSLH